MKHLLYALILVPILTGSTQAQQALAVQADRLGQEAPPPKPSHTVVKVTGDVTFKRQEWKQFAPARFGTVLRLGDLLKFDAGASTLVVCDGFGVAITISGPGSKPVTCPATKAPGSMWQRTPVVPTAHIDIGSSLALAATAPDYQRIHKLLSAEHKGAPKQSEWLAEMYGLAPHVTYANNPTFAWAAVPGADSYELRLHGPNLDWKNLVYTNDTFGADEVPTLEEGLNYSIGVVPMFKNKPLKTASVTAAAKLMYRTISVMRRPEAADVLAATMALAKLGLPDVVMKFLTAQVLVRSGSFDTALASLLGIQDQLKEPALLKELGEVYIARLSFPEATTSLTNAIALYEKNGDVIGRALAEEALANIDAKDASRVPQALVRYRVALETYRQLGDQFNVLRLEQMVSDYSVLQAAR